MHLGLRVVKVCRISTCLLTHSKRKTDPSPSVSDQNPGDREGKKRLKQKPTGAEDEYELSRFKPVVRSMLEVRLPLFSHFWSSPVADPSSFPSVFTGAHRRQARYHHLPLPPQRPHRTRTVLHLLPSRLSRLPSPKRSRLPPLATPQLGSSSAVGDAEGGHEAEAHHLCCGRDHLLGDEDGVPGRACAREGGHHR